jgi:hypothetical protein
MHLTHEIAPQGNDEEHAETSAGEADEDGLKGIRTEVKDIECGEREDSASHDRAELPPMPVTMTFSSRPERRL